MQTRLQIKTRIQLGIIFVLAILCLSLILSQKANPDFPPLFNLKRLQENFFLKLKSSPAQKVEYMSSLLDSRLIEIQNIINDQSYSDMLTTSLRYSTQAGKITDLIIANNLTDKVNPAKNQFMDHRKFLYALYVAYPKNTDNVEYKYIEDDINYLNLYLDKLSKI